MEKSLTITQYLNNEGVFKSVERALADKAPQFIASVTSLVSTNPGFANVDKKSLLSACMTAASLDLPINQSLGFAYIIPYKDVAQFRIGWKGLVQLAQRSGQYRTINVTEVKKGEIESRDRLTGDITFAWIEDDAEREKEETVGFVAYFELVNGFHKMLYMTKSELESHAKRYSQSYKANRQGMNPWRDDFDTMARKTVLKLLLNKFGVMTIEMQNALLSDQTAVKDGSVVYVDADDEVETTENKSGVTKKGLEAKLNGKKEEEPVEEVDEDMKNIIDEVNADNEPS